MNNKRVFLRLILIVASLSIILYILFSPEDGLIRTVWDDDHHEESYGESPKFSLQMEYDETLYQYNVRIVDYFGNDISLGDVYLNLKIGFETPYHFIGNITHSLEDYLAGINIVIPGVKDVNSTNTQTFIVRDFNLYIQVFDEDQNGLLTVGDLIKIKIFSEEPFIAGTQGNFYITLHNIVINNDWMGTCRCVGLLDMQTVDGDGSGSKPAEDREDE